MSPSVVAVLAALAVAAPGDNATATYTYSGRTLSLSLHYLMTCAQPGPGPLVVQLPKRWRLGNVSVAGRRSVTSGHSVTIAIPGPTGVTCMSIAPGTLRVRISGLLAPAGAYTVEAAIRKHAFAVHIRVP